MRELNMKNYGNKNPKKLIGKKKIDLLEKTGYYKVTRYPWAYDAWQRQERSHWLVEEISLSEDIKDFQTKITKEERSLISNILYLFAQSDIQVADNYLKKYVQIFNPLEIQMMIAAFSNIETVHLEAYAILLKTLGMPEESFFAFREYKEMAAKIDYMEKFGIKTCSDVTLSLAVFSAFTEGMLLFSSFIMLLNLSRFGFMRGLAQIVSLSLKDEQLHCESMIQLFHEWCAQTGTLTEEVKNEIYLICQQMVKLEDNFIDKAFEMGEIRGMQPQDIKNYIRFTADFRLTQLGLIPKYGYYGKETTGYKQILEHPLPWVVPIISGTDKVNMFENKVVDYSKGATGSTWNEIWENFDKNI